MIEEEFKKALSEVGYPDIAVDNSDGFDCMRAEWSESGEIDEKFDWSY